MDLVSTSALFVVSLLIGFAVFVFVWTLATGEMSQQRVENLSPLEKQRRLAVCQAKPSCRNFETLVQDLRPLVANFFGSERLSSLKKSLQFSAVYREMEADEFLSFKIIEGVLAGCIVGLIVALSLGLAAGLFSSIVVIALYVFLSEGEVTGIESRTKNQFLLRLPASVDLLALMLEAGATFPESLATIVRENQGHPIGEQLGQVEREMSLGRPRADALKSLRDRMNDPTVDEFIMAINEGEEFGTPLAKILSNQAERMRLKKSQWIEKAAAEAQVRMSFPTLLIMVACSLVVVGPFVLQSVFQFLGE
jgi:tight adherence protein C